MTSSAGKKYRTGIIVRNEGPWIFKPQILACFSRQVDPSVRNTFGRFLRSMYPKYGMVRTRAGCPIEVSGWHMLYEIHIFQPARQL